MDEEAHAMAVAMMMAKVEALKDEKRRKQKKAGTIGKGDTVDVIGLLFRYRSHLIKYGSDTKVSRDDVSGKTVILLFIALDHKDWYVQVASLVDIYNALGCFEVVFVPVSPKAPIQHDHISQLFEHMFSKMPWAAIPWHDHDSRNYLVSSFGIADILAPMSFAPMSFVIDEHGFVLQYLDGTLYNYSKYGDPGYPFTDDKLASLAAEDDDVIKCPTITKLLASPDRNYVIRNNNEQVPVCHLEDKVVALYLYEDNDKPIFNHKDRSLLEKVKRAYEELSGRANFEIVLIYIHDTFDTLHQTSEETFRKKFNTMPCLALPFKDPNVRKVLRFCGSTNRAAPDHTLVIIGPHGSYVEPYGAEILTRFGVRAYPYTRIRAAQLDVEDHVKGLKLEKLWDRNSFFLGQDSWSHVRLSEFEGKRVILLVEDSGVTNYTEFLDLLRAKYTKKDGEFEVIHINRNSERLATSPWMRLTFHDTQELKTLSDIFYTRTGLLAFDCDGSVVRRTTFPCFYTDDFPFYTDGLESEALAQLIDLYDWDAVISDKDTVLIDSSGKLVIRK